MTCKTAPYGTWASPIAPDLIAGHSLGIGDLAVGQRATGDACLYWLESRPAEAGRSVLVCGDGTGFSQDLTPPPFNVRSRVHEYGGGAYAVQDDVVVFSNFADNRVYRLDGTGKIAPLTAESARRFADFAFDAARGRVICVCEDHGGGGEPVNSLVVLDLDGAGAPKPLAGGHDFFAAPRLSLDGSQLAWVTWDHPNMPWDGSDLWCAAIRDDGSLGPAEHIAGGEAISVQQPVWSPDAVLHYVSDESGWWNLYRREGEGPDAGAVNLYPAEMEFGVPAWGFGNVTFRFDGKDRIICTPVTDGRQGLAVLADGRLTALESPFEESNVPLAFGGRLAIRGAGADAPGGLALLDPATGAVHWLRRSTSLAIAPEDVSRAEAFSFPADDGTLAHAFFYPPTNHAYRGPSDEAPPLIVMSHGGPTGATGTAFALKIQFWTSRGFAVVDVNYGGSTGYGRAYRARLDGKWGLVDAADCIAAARHLAAAGKVDGKRMAIRGGSAGGYTTLAALTFHDVFAAGTSLYGIGDLAALAADTHKFESRYLDRLIGPLPEAQALYDARSPLKHADRLNCPVLFLQGLDDKVVPPNQAEAMVAALKAKGLPVAYIAFEGEGHGFRRADTIQRALKAELAFYAQVFGFQPAGELETLEL